MMRKHEHFDKITEWIDKNCGTAAYGLPFIIALTNAFLEFGLSRGMTEACCIFDIVTTKRNFFQVKMTLGN